MWSFCKNVKFYNLIDRSSLFSILGYKVSGGGGQAYSSLLYPTSPIQATKGLVTSRNVAVVPVKSSV